jgi:hypothetical protein
VSNPTLLEGTGGSNNAVFTVTLDAAQSVDVTLPYATADGTAVSGQDYTATSGTLTFPAGTTIQTVSVPIATDGLLETDETFELRIGGVSGTATIQDDDPAPSLSIASASTSEGSGGVKSLSFAVSLSTVSGRATTVSYATSDGTALAGSDYGAANGTLTIPAGNPTGTIAVPLVTDRIFEPDETLTLTLSSPSGATLGAPVAVGTIVNDDAAGLSVNDVSVKEGQSGTTPLTFTVTLSPTSAGVVTVDYATVNGTAVAGSDYTGTSGTLTFPAGTAAQTVTVPVLGDFQPEPSETFLLRLSNAAGSAIASPDGTGTIQTDDGRADFDGDGKADLFWRNSSHELSLWLMDGTTVKGRVDYAPVPDGSRWSIVGAGDFNGDGKADLLWRDSITGRTFMWVMNAGPIVIDGETGYTSAQADTSWSVETVADFDGDGKSDVFWRRFDHSLALWLMDGKTVRSVVSYSPIPSGYQSSRAGDFNGDGKADVLWRDTVTGKTFLWMTVGGPLEIDLETSALADTSWFVVGVGDFDGDGKSDVFWRRTDHSLALWLMDGKTVKSVVSFAPIPSGGRWPVQGVGDFNGDGMADLLWRDTITGNTFLWMMNGGPQVIDGQTGYTSVLANRSWAVQDPR